MRTLLIQFSLLVVLCSVSWAQDQSKPDPLQQCQSALQVSNALGKQYYDSRDQMERDKVKNALAYDTYKQAYEQVAAKLKAVSAELEQVKKAKAE